MLSPRGFCHSACLAAGGLALLLIGCSRGDQSAQTPTSAPAQVSRLILPQSLAWSQQEASAHLTDAQAGVSAAIRLVHLAQAEPLCVAEQPSDAIVARLRVVQLDEELWALGVAPRAETGPQRLYAPVCIRSDGEVVQPVTGIDEELALLRVSRDADIFPHLLVTPERVDILAGELQPALELEPNQPVWFQCREKSGYGYIALLTGGASGPQEVAQYRWDPDEGMFLGPASDALPDPPGGKFTLNVPASERLVPMGGELPETKPILKPKPRRDQPPPRIVSPEEAPV